MVAITGWVTPEVEGEISVQDMLLYSLGIDLCEEVEETRLGRGRSRSVVLPQQRLQSPFGTRMAF